MLLQSNRHTAIDLEFWKSLEEADLVHGEKFFHSRRWMKSIELMHGFSTKGPCYVAVSWGKDSVALAHLHALSELNMPVVNIAQHGPQYDHDCQKVRDLFLLKFPQANYKEIYVTDDNSRQRDTDKAAGLITGISIANQLLGTNRYIGGIRAAESGVRRIGLRHRGLTCDVSCQPIGWWSDADVFGWLAYHRLPVHPAYGMTRGGKYDRTKIRVSIIGGAKGRNMGRHEWEQEYYGDILRRLQCKGNS